MSDAATAPRWVARAFAALSVEVYGLLVFGAAVRVNKAGLSCPDWPLCFGEVIPTMDLQVFLEWGHRVLAGTVSVLFLTISAAVAWSPVLRARAGRWVLAAGAVLFAQIVLGGLTVLHLLADWSVTSHLLAGNLFLAMVVSLTMALGGARAGGVVGASRGASVAVVGVLALQLALGGLVASNHAGLVCTEWPTCAGGLWFPSFEGLFRLQILHRFVAYTLFAGAWGLVAVSRGTPGVRRWALALAALVTVQAAMGIGNVRYALPQTLAIAHSGMAGLLTFVSTRLLWAVFGGELERVRERGTEGAPAPSRSPLGGDLRGRGRSLAAPGAASPCGERSLPTLATSGPVGANGGGVPSVTPPPETAVALGSVPAEVA